MLIKCFPVGHLEENCYIVADEDSLLCAVVDPGDESNTILDYVEETKLRVQDIFLTHGHFDHTGAVEALLEETGAQLWMHRRDASEGESDGFSYDAPEGTKFYKEGDEIAVGALRFTVMETPGHSPGSVTLKCGEALFTGDTLFRGGAGRTDLPGGDTNTLMASLKRLAFLPGDYEVWPGHMDGTTLDRERMTNYYLRRAAGVR